MIPIYQECLLVFLASLDGDSFWTSERCWVRAFIIHHTLNTCSHFKSHADLIMQCQFLRPRTPNTFFSILFFHTSMQQNDRGCGKISRAFSPETEYGKRASLVGPLPLSYFVDFCFFSYFLFTIQKIVSFNFEHIYSCWPGLFSATYNIWSCIKIIAKLPGT